MIVLQVFSEVDEALEKLRKYPDNMAITYERIGDYVLGEFRKNFDEEGRPIHWVKSVSALKEGRKTLYKTGALFLSITSKNNSFGLYKRLKHSVHFGSILPYAAIHNYGGMIKAFGKYPVRIEKREYVNLPRDAKDKIREIVIQGYKEAIAA